MWRRLYFIFPDEAHAVKVLDDLQRLGLDRSCVHAIPGKGVTLNHFPPATKLQTSDFIGRVARLLWDANLILFAGALFGFAVALYVNSDFGVVLAVAVMVVTFFSGAFYAIRVPDTRLTEFKDVLAHGEIVLLVDVPRFRVDAVERMVCRRHPEAIPGGVSWTIRMLHA